MTANLARDWPYPRLVAHRGASAYAPENTMAAFELAVRQRADHLADLDHVLCRVDPGE